MSVERPARLLGVDVGERRIGVAVSEGRIAVPLTIIEHRSRDADVARIAGIAREQAVVAVVVGLPVSLSGAEHAQAKLTRTFGQALARRVDVPVVYQDERYTTVRARTTPEPLTPAKEAAARKPPRRKGERPVDDLAAALILQAYIDAREQPG
jgi:putative Holliday junction resolvase